MVNEHYFDNINSEIQAYLLGFITADGTINDTRKTPVLQVHISTKDNYIVRLLENEIGNTVKTYYSPDGKRVAFRTSSEYLCNKLREYYIMPRKTGYEELAIDILPSNLLSHYIRGLIDGDGWICNTKLKAGGVRKNIGFCGSELACEQLRDHFTRLLDTYPVKVSKVKGKNNYKINYASKTDIQRILRYIYGGATVFLERKYIEAIA